MTFLCLLSKRTVQDYVQNTVKQDQYIVFWQLYEWLTWRVLLTIISQTNIQTSSKWYVERFLTHKDSRHTSFFITCKQTSFSRRLQAMADCSVFCKVVCSATRCYICDNDLWFDFETAKLPIFLVNFYSYY